SEIRFLEPADTATPNAFWKLRAKRAARGLYPRTLLGEQSFWTIIGQVDDEHEALINEEGQIEVDRRSFSIEPFIVREDGKLLTWADATSHEQSLRDGWMPIPTVVRKHDGLELSITAVATKDGTRAAYTLRNTGTTQTRGQFVLAIRPIQVLPPWQDLNITGGWTPIKTIRAQRGRMEVNHRFTIASDNELFATCSGYNEGDPLERLAAGERPGTDVKAILDPLGSASGLMSGEFALEPGASMTHVVRISTTGQGDAEPFDTMVDRVAAEWSARVDRVTLKLPPSAKQFADTIRATQAYILINHDGKGFQPGSRTYERSWIRDGSMTSAAMLEFGHDHLVKRFIDWYAPFQFDSGKVPCVVDRRGADPTAENDSHGQLIWLIANAHRFTGDVEIVHRQFPRVKKAVEYIESLRAQRLTDEFGPNGKPRQEPNKPPVPALAFRGLVPESISHEGYSAKPMHSFWDQFYILRGLNDAAYLAKVEGDKELAQRWQKLADDFRTSLIESLRIAHKAHGIDYLPGCVELGDFDSASSTILLWPVDEASKFPKRWIDATFERYWNEFTRRRDSSTWEAYTPYELRHVGAFVRMGQKDRAWQMLDWFFAHQRPLGWRHWAEVVWRERSTPRMIGDMPHTWCGSDFLNAARAMFVYEDQQKLILFSGIPDAWATDPAGVSFEGLRTEFGAISASITSSAPDKLVVRIEGKANPKDGFDLCSPLSKPVKSVRIDGREAAVADGNRVHVDTIPTTIELTY
ncbi:MAG: coagulation factor 5/8 type domain-containing protein, partial [Anaerolineae bacterium]|nr:coagulation factor 5/8 type domain-containing protein [Phycisphaerae bacterium]